MPTTRNILGHIRFEEAVGNRTCDVSEKHLIGPGEKHLAYEKVQGQRINICMACDPAIIAAAQAHLAMIEQELGQ